MKKIIKTLFPYFSQRLTSLWLALFLFPFFVSAQTSNPVINAMRTTINGANLAIPDGDPEVTLGNFISATLGFIGIVFMLLLIYAGILWMGAQGNEEKVDKAKKLIYSSVIGLVIVLAAYLVSVLVLTLIQSSIF